MKRILVLALSLLSLYGYSQTVSVGVRGGLSVPNVIAGGDNPLSKGYSSRFAGTGGILAELGINNLLSLRLGVEYSGQGGNRNGVQAMATNQLMSSVISKMGASASSPEVSAMLGQIGNYLPSIFYADVKNEAKFDYLMIPLSLQVGKDFGNSWRVYLGAGPFVSFLLSAKQVSKGQSYLYSDAAKSQTLWEYIPSTVKPLITGSAPELAYALASEMEFGTTDIKDDLRKVNVGIQGDLGLSYQCNRNKLSLEVGGNYGFVKLQKEEANGSNRIGSATVMLGYAYRLGK
ncbi:hypothetical protein EZS27_010216 [termite gut metagenome]|uniref:Outer membrane protein beta-barrel domain-containing protein n=1 Tax=termite gut metagenome TaxID=433724 RepID=A0A5J4S9V5_9ZZZZ